MVKWKRVIAFDVIMAILIILLYSPFQLGLSPLDPNFINAAMSVVCAAFIAYGLIKVNGKALLTARAEKRMELGPGEATVDDIKLTLAEYEKTSVVAPYAKHGIDELERAERKREQLYAIVGKKFQEGSLTWQKFIEGVETATQAIAHNTALLAKRIQAFDVQDYNRNARNTITGMFHRNEIPESVRREKRTVYEASLDDMRGIVAANERLLVELDRFAVEMDQLETSANAEVNNHLLAEINTLVEETQYYR